MCSCVYTMDIVTPWMCSFVPDFTSIFIYLLIDSDISDISSKRGMIKVQKCTFIAYAIPMLEVKVKFA